MKFLQRKVRTLPFVYLFGVAVNSKALEAVGDDLFIGLFSAIAYHGAWHIV